MRWLWIDRFTEFERGHRAVAVKCVALGEEQLDGYWPACPMMPSSLIVEGIAQTGGLLVGEYSDFEHRVVLAKVGRASFHLPATPGNTLTYTAEVEDIRPDGSFIKGTSHLGDRLQAEVDIVFAYLDDRFEGIEQFEPVDFLRLLRVLGLYDVGRKADGSPLDVPARLLQAERAAAGSANSRQ